MYLICIVGPSNNTIMIIIIVSPHVPCIQDKLLYNIVSVFFHHITHSVRPNNSLSCYAIVSIVGWRIVYIHIIDSTYFLVPSLLFTQYELLASAVYTAYLPDAK